ncbi:MAG TPA: hypothetical protein VH142_17675 [Polyangiaceae bacterium]|jgi:hypothetical protein|nr:hypothetical protein [Polyangiaceae bacterium]
MLDPLFQLILEIAGEFLFNVVSELIFEGFSKALQSRHKSIVFVALLILGVTCGGISVAFYPAALLPQRRPLPAAALILIPVVIGFGMRSFGIYQRRRGRQPTQLATFLGGATVAFAYTLTRLFAHGASGH